MTESPAPGAAEQAGARAMANTTLRAAAEIVGKLVSLLLFAAIAREGGHAGLGAFVLAFAFGQLVLVPVDFGLDRQLTRRVAESPPAAGRLWKTVHAVKLALLVPIVAVAAVALLLLGYSRDTRLVVVALLPGLVFDSLARTAFGVLQGIERGGPIGIGIVAQRVTGAGLGVLMLGLGHGVPAAAAGYSAGAAFGYVLTVVLLDRHVGLRRAGGAQPAGWSLLLRTSLPFGLQEVFSVLLFRLDALILALLATEAAVGRYGAAFRLFEATLFVSYSLSSAFSAMYTYLGLDTVPSIGAAFGRSLKAALAILVPCAVALGVLAEPILTTIYGDDFAVAAPALRLLAPVVVLVGVFILSASLIAGRGDPAVTARLTGLMVLVNVGLNLALIPAYEEQGAAAAMLVTEAVLVLAVLRLAAPLVGHLPWRPTAAGPLLAGAAMFASLLVVESPWIPALVLGGFVYVASLVVFERVTCPEDVAFVRRMLGRRRSGARA